MRMALMSAGILTCCAVAAPQTFRKHDLELRVGPNPSAIASRDLNGDGLPEIITANVGEMRSPRDPLPANNTLSFLLAQENMAYTKQPEWSAGFAPYCIAIANVDALKAPDVVVGNFHTAPGREISVFRNIGENAFEPLEFSAFSEHLGYRQRRDDDGEPVFTRPGITSLVVDFFDNDDYRDIVAAGWSSDRLIFVPGAPQKYFGEARFIPAKGGPRDIQAADFDRDGVLDLVVTLYNVGELALWKGDGNGNFDPVDHFKTRGDIAHKVRIGDINGDGKTDLLVSHCFSEDSIVLFYGEGDFKFTLSQELALGEKRDVLEHEIRDVAIDDFNGDGRSDIAAACFASGQVTVLINASTDEALPQQFKREVYAYADARPRALSVADFNRDGAQDLAVALWDANAVGLLLSRHAQ